MRNEMYRSRSNQPELETQDTDTRMKRKQDFKKSDTRGWIISLLAAVAIALLLRFFVFEFIRVDGSSMEPTLYTDEYVFMEKVSYRFSEPSRGDIVICHFPGRTETFVKRVIGIEGDRLRITEGILYINDEASYDYYEGPMNTEMPEIIVPQNAVFVMGDNRNHSMDSTNSGVGALPYNMILGKAVFVLWPLNMIHGL